MTVERAYLRRMRECQAARVQEILGERQAMERASWLRLLAAIEDPTLHDGHVRARIGVYLRASALRERLERVLRERAEVDERWERGRLVPTEKLLRRQRRYRAAQRLAGMIHRALMKDHGAGVGEGSEVSIGHMEG